MAQSMPQNTAENEHRTDQKQEDWETIDKDKGVLHNQCPKTPKKMNTEQIRKRKIEEQWAKINGCSFMIPKEG